MDGHTRQIGQGALLAQGDGLIELVQRTLIVGEALWPANVLGHRCFVSRLLDSVIMVPGFLQAVMRTR